MSCTKSVNLDICTGLASFLIISPNERVDMPAIASITNAFPCVVETETAHGLAENWPVVFESIKGMDDLNAKQIPGDIETDGYYCSILDTTRFQLIKNTDNGALFVNSTEYGKYKASSGIIRTREKYDLTGCDAEMLIYGYAGNLIDTLNIANNKLTLDNASGRCEIIADETLRGLVSAETSATHSITITFPDLTVITFSGSVTV